MDIFPTELKNLPKSTNITDGKYYVKITEKDGRFNAKICQSINIQNEKFDEKVFYTYTSNVPSWKSSVITQKGLKKPSNINGYLQNNEGNVNTYYFDIPNIDIYIKNGILSSPNEWNNMRERIRRIRERANLISMSNQSTEQRMSLHSLPHDITRHISEYLGGKRRINKRRTRINKRRTRINKRRTCI